MFVFKNVQLVHKDLSVWLNAGVTAVAQLTSPPLGLSHRQEEAASIQIPQLYRTLGLRIRALLANRAQEVRFER
jgi:hypothetical protein